MGETLKSVGITKTHYLSNDSVLIIFISIRKKQSCMYVPVKNKKSLFGLVGSPLLVRAGPLGPLKSCHLAEEWA